MTRDDVLGQGFPGERRQILDRLVATLRPGGWVMTEAGFERDYGRRVVSDIEAAGLTDIRGEGRARLIGSTSPGFDFSVVV